jgi:hypothetical protein
MQIVRVVRGLVVLNQIRIGEGLIDRVGTNMKSAIGIFPVDKQVRDTWGRRGWVLTAPGNLQCINGLCGFALFGEKSIPSKRIFLLLSP